MELPTTQCYAIFYHAKYSHVANVEFFVTRELWEAQILVHVKNDDEFKAVSMDYASVKTTIKLPADYK